VDSEPASSADRKASNGRRVDDAKVKPPSPTASWVPVSSAAVPATEEGGRAKEDSSFVTRGHAIADAANVLAQRVELPAEGSRAFISWTDFSM